jgi:hypothetical protein
LPPSRHDGRAREPSIGLGATPQTLLTLVPRPWQRITWQAIRSVWTGIGRPNRPCEPDSEKKFQQGESMVDVLAVAIFVHQESVALALRCARARNVVACTKSLFHRFFFDVARNRSCARDDASLIHRRSALHDCKKPQRLVSAARNPRFIERTS